MPIHYVKKPSDGEPKPEENWLVWFSGEGIDDCNNALLLYGSGEIHLLKTIRVVGRDELGELNLDNWSDEDYQKWEEIFGTGAASNELRSAFRHFLKVNAQP